MEDRSKHIDDLFREGLGDYKEAPGAGVWDALEQRLPAGEPAAVAEQPSRRWLWYLLLLLLLGTAGYILLRRSSQESSSERNKINEQIDQPAGDGVPATANSSTPSGSGPNGYEESGAGFPAGNNSSGNSDKGTGSGDADTYGSDHSGNTSKSSGRSENVRRNKSGASGSYAGASEATAASESEPNNNASARTGTTRNRNRTKSVAGSSATTNGSNPSNDGDTRRTGTDNSIASRNRTNRSGAATTTLGSAKAKQTTTATQNSGNALTEAGSIDQGIVAANAAGKAAGKKKNTKENPTSDKPLYIPETPEKAAGKPISVKGETAKGNPINVDPARFKANEPIASLPENYSKNGKIQVNGAAGGRSKATSSPAAKQEPATYQATSEGYKMVMPEEAEEATATVAKEIVPAANTAIAAPYTAVAAEEPAKAPAKPEEKQEEEIVEIAAPATGGGGGGGGGGAEPAVALRNFNKINLEGGIKAGYERGFGGLNAAGPVISPYIQWNISPKLAFVLMPAFRYNQINMMELFAQQAYHRITSQTRDSLHTQSQDSLQGPMIQRRYFYKNTYDSIVAGYKINEQKFWEIDLPLLLKYKLSDKLSMLVGPYLTFGNLIQIEGSTKEYTGFKREDSLIYAPVPDSSGNPGGNNGYPNPPGITNYFYYNTPAYTGSSPAAYANPATNPARFGLMFGLSYELGKRVLIDVLVRQNVSDMRYIANEQVRKTYTTPYIRTTIGVRLFGTQNKEPKNVNGL